MRRAGCALAVVGVLLCAGGFVAFGSSVFRAFAAREAHVSPIVPGGTASADLTVDTAKFCQIAVRGLVRSEHVRESTRDSVDLDLLFAFPFSYTVIDGDGRVIQSQEKDFSSDSGGPLTASRERITQDGGSAQLEQGFEKFAVAPPGRIRVEASLGTDADYGATLESVEVVVYDNVSKHAKRVGIGVGLLVAGGVLTMLGFVLVIVAAARSGSAAKSPPPIANR